RVALHRRGAALREGGQEAVGRTGRAGADSRLGVVARPSRRAAHLARVPRRMLAGVSRPVTRVGGARVAVVGARPAARLLRVGGTVGPAARAAIGLVAFARRRPADGARGREAIGGTCTARARARLGHVAHAGCRPAHRPGVARGVLTGHVRPVALVGRARVAVVGARRAARLLHVGGAGRARAAAHLRHVALARRAAARRARRQELAVRAAAHAARDPGIAVLARRRLDRAVAAQRRERDGHEVPVARLRATRVAGIATDVAAGRRAARLALADRRLAGVAAHRAVPGEAERVALRDSAAEAEDLRRATRLVERRIGVPAPIADDARIGEAERPGAEGDVRAPGHAARVGRPVAVAGIGGPTEGADPRGRDVEAVAAHGGGVERDVVLGVAAGVVGAGNRGIGVDVPGVPARERAAARATGDGERGRVAAVAVATAAAAAGRAGRAVRGARELRPGGQRAGQDRQGGQRHRRRLDRTHVRYLL